LILFGKYIFYEENQCDRSLLDRRLERGMRWEKFPLKKENTRGGSFSSQIQ